MLSDLPLKIYFAEPESKPEQYFLRFDALVNMDFRLTLRFILMPGTNMVGDSTLSHRRLHYIIDWNLHATRIM